MLFFGEIRKTVLEAMVKKDLIRVSKQTSKETDWIRKVYNCLVIWFNRPMPSEKG